MQYVVSVAKIPSTEYTMNLLIYFASNNSDSKPELRNSSVTISCNIKWVGHFSFSLC